MLACGSLFTVVPLPMVHVDRGVAAGAIRWFPWLGLLLGLVSGVVAAAVASFGTGPLLPVVVGVALVHALTGAMHLDGLADVADGLGSRKPAQAAIAIMKRSDIGPMGVAAILLVVLLDIAALSDPDLSGSRLVLIAALTVGPLLGRLQALAGTRVGVPPAHSGGFAALLAGATSTAALAAITTAAWGVALVAGYVVRGLHGLVAFGVAAVAAAVVGLVWERVLRSRFGGLTGDCWGSLSETAQMTFWIVLAALL